MPDRTYVEVTFATADLEKVKDIFLPPGWREHGYEFSYEQENPDGTVCAALDEVSFGGMEQAEAMEKAGIPFHLYHDAGCDYGEGMMAFDGSRLNEIKSLEKEIVVIFDRDAGVVRKADLEFARQFTALWNSAMAAILRRQNAGGEVEPPAHKLGRPESERA